MSVKVLIIEDEFFAQAELKRLIKVLRPQWEVEECLESVEDAVAFLKGKPSIDLLFSDIQLTDGQSFRIFEQVEVHTPIIFTTAYNEFALKAFEQNSIDYLVKPILEESLEKAIAKFEQYHQKETPKPALDTAQLQALLNLAKPKAKSRIVVKLGDQIKFIELASVAYFYAEDNVVFLVEQSGKKHIVDHTLEELSEQVDAARFFRINRAYLVAIDAIQKVSKYFNNRLKLTIAPSPEEETLVTRSRVDDFLKWLEQ